MPRSVPRDELHRWFCTPRCGKGERLVGVEYEFLVTDLRSRREAPFDGPRGVEAILGRLRELGPGWKPVEEGGRLIALEREDGSAVTLEPGSQLEFATVPRRSVLEVEADLRAFVSEFKSATDGMELALLATGLNPFSGTLEVPLGPKRRYGIMNEYLPKTGDLALDMMRRTLSVHCSFDYKSEEEAAELTRLGMAVAPIVTSIFAHSPIDQLAPNGYASFRAEVWRRTDPDRCGSVFEAFRPDFDFQRYVDRIFQLPLMFTLKAGVLRPAYGFPAGRWFAGEWDGLAGHEGLEPEAADLEWVINQSFWDARLRRYLECRAADFPSPEMANAPVALYAGLLYDAGARRGAWDVLKDLSVEERHALAADVPARALQAKAGRRTVLEIARELAVLSRQGLVTRGLGEETLLDPMDALLAEGITPAERLLERWKPGDPDSLIELLRF